MKKIAPILALILCVNSYANTPFQRWLEANQIVHPDSLDILAQFPGGKEAQLKFLKEHIAYPQEAIAQGIEGIVYIVYIIDEYGNTSDMRIRGGLGGGISEEVLRVVGQMPRWEPGTINGEPQRTAFQMSVGFALSDTNAIVTPILTVGAYRAYRDLVPHHDSLCVFPEFPGGIQAMRQFLQRYIIFPEAAYQQGIRGTVLVTFVVERDGSISDVGVLRGIGGGCDEEAVRVVTAMPNWNPGMVNDQPVRVDFTMPIRFTASRSTAPTLYREPSLFGRGRNRGRN